jgi:hypothetical protein
MTRRAFIKNTAVVGTAVMLPSVAAALPAKAVVVPQVINRNNVKIISTEFLRNYDDFKSSAVMVVEYMGKRQKLACEISDELLSELSAGTFVDTKEYVQDVMIDSWINDEENNEKSNSSDRNSGDWEINYNERVDEGVLFVV